jgi:hypothetical protein
MDSGNLWRKNHLLQAFLTLKQKIGVEVARFEAFYGN